MGGNRKEDSNVGKSSTNEQKYAAKAITNVWLISAPVEPNKAAASRFAGAMFDIWRERNADLLFLKKNVPNWTPTLSLNRGLMDRDPFKSGGFSFFRVKETIGKEHSIATVDILVTARLDESEVGEYLGLRIPFRGQRVWKRIS